MLRVVPDVNIIISALLNPAGPPGRIYDSWVRGELIFVTSLPIIDKAVEVLRRDHISAALNMAEADIRTLQATLLTRSLLTPHQLILDVVKDDPEDNTIIVAAIEGDADCIISGDRHLTNLDRYQDIPICTPTEFIDRYYR